jgi:Flavin-binding monooxygenase-like
MVPVVDVFHVVVGFLVPLLAFARSIDWSGHSLSQHRQRNRLRCQVQRNFGFCLMLLFGWKQCQGLLQLYPYISSSLLRRGCSSFVRARVASPAATTSSSMSDETHPRVCIIGCGAAGLAAAKACVQKGWIPTVVERSHSIGGVWNYVEKQTAAMEMNSWVSPMYRGLRTNLPVEIMQFRDFEWWSKNRAIPNHESRRSFVTHYQVQAYLQDYCRHFGLDQFIRLSTTVTSVSLSSPQTSSWCSPSTEKWPLLEITTLCNGSAETEVYDGVMVCNGHYGVPSVPAIAGLEEHFVQGPNEQTSLHPTVEHSASYDNPEKYVNRTILCIGGRASGSDLVRKEFWLLLLSMSNCRCDKSELGAAGKKRHGRYAGISSRLFTRISAMAGESLSFI